MTKKKNSKRNDSHMNRQHIQYDEDEHGYNQQQQQHRQQQQQLFEHESEYSTIGDGSSVGGNSSVGNMNRSRKGNGSLMEYNTPERMRKRENDSFASPEIPLIGPGAATGDHQQQQQQQKNYSYGLNHNSNNASSSRRRFANALSSSGNILRGSSSSLKSSMYSSPFYGNPSSNQFLHQHQKYNQNQQYRWISWLMRSILASPMIVLVLWMITWIMNPFHYRTNEIQQQQLIQPPSPRNAVRVPARPKKPEQPELNAKQKQKQKKIREIQQRQQRQQQPLSQKQQPFNPLPIPLSGSAAAHNNAEQQQHPQHPVTTNKILPIYVPLGNTEYFDAGAFMQQENNGNGQNNNPNQFKMTADNQVITDAQGQPVMTMTTDEEGQPIFMTADEEEQPPMTIMTNQQGQPVMMTTDTELEPVMLTTQEGRPVLMLPPTGYQQEGQPVMEYSNMMMQPQQNDVLLNHQKQNHNAHVVARHRPPVRAINTNKHNSQNKQNNHPHSINNIIPPIYRPHINDNSKNDHHSIFPPLPHPHGMGRAQNQNYNGDNQPIQRIYYYDPLESPDGRQLPSQVYDTQGQPIPLSSLMESSAMNDADIYLEPPPVRGARSPPAMMMTQNQRDGNDNQPLPYPQEQLNLNDIKTHIKDGTANMVPSIPTFWGESTFQDQSIIVATVAVMALLVGALSARRLRSRAFLSSCIENESLEEEIAYDAAFTSDNYHTFSYKGDLEKFDV